MALDTHVQRGHPGTVSIYHSKRNKLLTYTKSCIRPSHAILPHRNRHFRLPHRTIQL